MNMADILPVRSNVGLTSVDHFEAPRDTLPSRGDGQMVGGKVRESVRRLYEPFTINHLAIEFTVPTVHPELLHPNRFAAALLDVVDKMESMPESGPALEVVKGIKTARDTYNFVAGALNLV
jgi:hypothetical protein